ncbi:hypothetical protein JBO49_02795 [Serratia fonticola]|uniref:hypothetical protein n=1 Tax=Serratia fonticola TaxID=47917 RepID=UPI00192A9EB3|nr:hypothetical protein [Serratia fonticola]MBL5859540.1 hypothetical protein [Serratia fonticola]
MVKELIEVPIQEAFDHLKNRIKHLELESVKQQMASHVQDALFSCLILAHPEPEKINDLWKTLGTETVNKVTASYLSAYENSADLKKEIQSASARHLESWQSYIDEVIDVRKPGTEESAPSE